MTGETPRELAEAYTEALESRADGDEYDDTREHLDALRSRLKRFAESYGDSDPATEELKERVQSAEDEVANLEQQRREPEELERELLESARRFMLDNEWLRPDVIKALNRALVGAPHETLRVDDFELSGPEDAEGLDDVTRFDIIDVIRKLAMDKMGEGDAVESAWQSIEGSTREEPFRIVSRMGSATSKDVMKAVDEDITRKDAKNRLNNAIYHLDINPYYREDGTFSLSTAGRYIAVEYAGAESSDKQGASDEDAGSDGQTTLEAGAAKAKGRAADE